MRERLAQLLPGAGGRSRGPHLPLARAVDPARARGRGRPAPRLSRRRRGRARRGARGGARASATAQGARRCCAPSRKAKRSAERRRAPRSPTPSRPTSARCRSRNWVDFDDLVGLAAQLLATDPALAARYRERFRSVSVDEFQDIDEQQYRLLRLLRRRRRSLRHRRSRPGDLRLPRRRCLVLRALRARLSRAPGRAARAQLPLERHHRHRVLAGHRRAAATVASRRPCARCRRASLIHAAPTERARPSSWCTTIEQHDRRTQFLLDRQRPRRAGGRARTCRSPTSPCSTAPRRSRRAVRGVRALRHSVQASIRTTPLARRAGGARDPAASSTDGGRRPLFDAAPRRGRARAGARRGADAAAS